MKSLQGCKTGGCRTSVELVTEDHLELMRIQVKVVVVTVGETKD